MCICFGRPHGFINLVTALLCDHDRGLDFEMKETHMKVIYKVCMGRG